MDLIEAKLRHIEREKGIRILYACESGSRAWGMASDDSDYDIRCVYRQPGVDPYLAISGRRNDTFRVQDGLLDIEGWDVTKAAHRLLKSNAAIVEWTLCPQYVRHESWEPVMDWAGKLENINLRAVAEHYRSMAYTAMNRKVREKPKPTRIKDYLYVVRPYVQLAYIVKNGCLGYPGLITTAMAVMTDGVLAELREMIAAKKSSESDTFRTRDYPKLMMWVTEQGERGRSYCESIKPTRPDADDLNDIIVELLKYGEYSDGDSGEVVGRAGT